MFAGVQYHWVLCRCVCSVLYCFLLSYFHVSWECVNFVLIWSVEHCIMSCCKWWRSLSQRKVRRCRNAHFITIIIPRTFFLFYKINSALSAKKGDYIVTEDQPQIIGPICSEHRSGQPMYLFISWRLVAPSTTQGHLKICHKFKS